MTTNPSFSVFDISWWEQSHVRVRRHHFTMNIILNMRLSVSRVIVYLRRGNRGAINRFSISLVYWSELNWTELTKRIAIKNWNSCLLTIYFMPIDHRRSSSPFPASEQLDFFNLLLFCNTKSTYSGTYLISIFFIHWFFVSFLTLSFHFSFSFFQPILHLFLIFFIFVL